MNTMSTITHLTLVVLVVLQVTWAEGSVRLVCPSPISPTSDQDSVSFLEPSFLEPEIPSSSDVTDIDPGLFTVHFEETKFQKDSPFRISLHDISAKIPEVNNTNYSSTSNVYERKPSCLLLDHIPHNNHAIISKDCSQGANKYPVGICNGSSYYITVKIPDVACDDCLLMLQQVITKPDHQVCNLNEQNDTASDSGCIVYTSFAQVRIRPSDRGSARDLSHCSEYLGNLPGEWPYRPQHLYQTEEGAMLTHDLLHRSLHIKIPNNVKLGPVERVEIWQNVTVIWNTTVKDNTGHSVLVTWENISETDVELLKGGLLVLNVIGSKKSLAADIQFTEEHFSEGKLSGLHDVYSESGWLVAPQFLGPKAEDPAAALPSGLCAPRTSHYMANLQSVHVTAHGILGMTVIEKRAYITVVLHVDHEVIQSIRIKGPDLVDIPMLEIKVPSSFNGVIQAAFDITLQMQFIDTVRFFKIVEVNTDKEEAVLLGDLEEGMYTVLRDETGDIHGMGGLQFTQGQWLKVDVVLNDLSPTVQSAVLNGPNIQLLDISRETVHCTQAFCCLDAIHHEPSSELVLHLMKGQTVLHVVTPKGNVTGKIQVSPLRYCQLMAGACHEKFHQYSIAGLGVEERSGEVALSQTKGWSEAEAFVLDRANVLHYCVQLDNLNMTARYFTVSLMRNGRKMVEVPFKPIPDMKASYLACNKLPLEDNLPFIASLGRTSHKWVILVISAGDDKFLSQDLPSISRGDCIHSKIHIVGQEQHYWSLASAPLQDIYAVVTDHLKFIFDKNTTLYLMASKDEFEDCNFATAKQLTALDTVGEKDFYFFTMTRTGRLYFADLYSCNATQPLKLTVYVTEGINMVQDDSHDEWCRKSVYGMWREQQLKSWEEPEVSGPILIGLVVGLSSAGAFLLWQGIRLKRIPDSFRGNSDSVFVRF